MNNPVIAETTIQAPIESVWKALREPEQIRRWHGWMYDGLNDEIRAIYLDGAHASDDDHTVETGAGRFEMKPDGTRTFVRITRPAPAGHTTWQGLADEVNDGWVIYLQQLRYYLERHQGEDRRTVMLQSAPPDDGELWFRSGQLAGWILDDHTLVTTPHNQWLVSMYGADDAAFARLTERLGG